MNRLGTWRRGLVCALLALASPAWAADEAEFTLENIFPEKGLFGPSASGADFSADGRYGAYLYRTYPERRHGSDLWLHDADAGTVTRITSVSVMADHQASAREVGADRIEHAKKNAKAKASDASAAPTAPWAGVWEGSLRSRGTGSAASTRLTFRLELLPDAAGAITGTLTALMIRAEVDGAEFDAETGRLECRLRGGANSGLSATLTGTIEDDAITGELVIAGMAGRLVVDGRRTDGGSAASTGDAGTDDAEGDARDRVLDDDADREKAPRYAGIAAFVWAPDEAELIFVSGGDLYRFDVETRAIRRLTRTRERERDVQYLPDGSGYTYLRDGALMKVSFADHVIEQIDPRLPSGETMQSYRLSPDGSRLAFLAGKGNRGAGSRTVSIVNYRNRFAQVREFPRHMPDEQLPDYEWSVYLYDLDGHRAEKGTLKKVFTHKRTGFRDVVPVPRWAPDSSRAAFAVFAQSTGEVEIRESRIEEATDEDEETAAAVPDEDGATSTDDDGDDDEQGEDDAPAPDADEEEPKIEIEEARVIYRFLHAGGPNTPRMIDPHYLADSRRLLFLTEQTGFRQLHVLDPLYENLEPLTRGRYEVYPLALSEDHERVFVTATRADPAQEQVYMIDLADGVDDAAMTRLSPEKGVYSGVAVSDDGTRVLARHATYGMLPELVTIDVADGTQTRITDSHPEKAAQLTSREPEFFTLENRHGQTLHGHMFKPDDWTPDDQRPLLIYVYGGPLGTRKMVVDGSYSSDAYFFAQYMARAHGYVTCTVDPRGASGYGGLFEKSNFEQVGKPQVEDLVDTARWFVKHQAVDEDRMAMHGWSFGGFQTQMCLYTEPDVFACGIAGAGPTEWENYNTWYSTGTIGASRTGKTDLAKYSLLPLAKNLKAKLLLVHGMEDSNVLYQDTVRVYRELLKAGKETLVELFLDPTGGHGLGGDVKRLNRMRKYEEFLVRVLGREGE